MNLGTVVLFAFGVFFLTGVVTLLRQGVRNLAAVVFVLAALAITGGVLRL